MTADRTTASAAGATLASGALLNTLAFLSSNLRAIFTFLVARLLGGSILGTFGVAWATVDLASKFATLGLDYSGIAWVARAEAGGDRAGSRRVMTSALTIAMRASACVTLVGFALAVTSDRTLGIRPDLAIATAVMFLGVPGITLYRVSNALSRGMKVMQHDVYSRGLTESLVTAAALLVAVALGATLLAPEAAAIAGTLASGCVAFALARRLFVRAAPLGPGAEATGLLRASMPIAAYDLLNIGVMRIDVIMLGLFVGRAPAVTLESIGVYAACVEIAGGLRKLSQAFTPILTPVLAEQIGAGRIRDAEESYGYVARWMLALLLPAAAVLALSGGAILSIFGSEFRSGSAWVAVVGAACALNAFVGLGETILMIERPAWNVVNTSVAFAAAVALNLVLIPSYGPLGAAIGMLVPYMIQGLLRGVEISRLLKWRWPWRSLLRPWLAALAALPLALIVRLSGSGIGVESAAGSLYLLAYLAAWRVIGLNSHDRAVLAQLRDRASRSGST